MSEALDELSTITDEIPDDTVVTAPDHAGYTLLAAATQTDRAAAVTGASRLMAWDFDKGRPAVILDRQLPQEPRDMAMSGDGRHVAVTFPDAALVLDLDRGDEKSVALTEGLRSFVSAALSPDGNRLALGDYDGQVVVLDVQSGNVLMRAAVGSSTVQQFTICDEQQGFRCMIPGFDGALSFLEWKDALWARFSMGAPRRQRRSVERYSIVKRA